MVSPSLYHHLVTLGARQSLSSDIMMDMPPRMVLTDLVRTWGTSTSVTHSKLSSVPHSLRLSLFKFIRLPPLDLRLWKRSGNFLTAILCSNSSILTWRKLHVKVPFMGGGQRNQQPNCHVSLRARHNSGYISTLPARPELRLKTLLGRCFPIEFFTTNSATSETIGSILHELLRSLHVIISRKKKKKNWKSHDSGHSNWAPNRVIPHRGLIFSHNSS